MFRSSILFVFALAVAPSASIRVANAQTSRPDIILIMADNLGYGDVGCYGSPDMATPNIDRIAAQGVRFTNFYSNGPECSPTRTALLTGRYQQRIPGLECALGTGNVGRYDDAIALAEQNNLGLPPDKNVLIPLLNQAGYKTVGIGKWHLGYERHERVIFLPPEKELVEEVKALKAAEKLPQEIVLTLREWKHRENTADKARVYEAAWIGLKMLAAGVRHSHSHFAGIGARTGWWLRQFYGFSYSFTGHANDLFCKNDLALRLDDLMCQASLVVTVSDYTVANLQERFPGAQEKVKRVYNGLDLVPFAGAGERRDLKRVWEGKEPPLILSVGRLIEKKGYDDLVRACAGLRERGIENFRCVIIGDGPMEEELRVMIQSLGVEDRVELAGPKSQAEIIEFLEIAALFALPCVTEKDGGKDNLPTVLMEAMAARVACASTVLAGVPEMVIEGETGRLVPEREPEQFSGIVAEMLQAPERTNQMAEAGCAHAREHFAKEVTARQLRRLLVACGRTRFDAGLVAKDPGLIGSYLGQWWRRILRKL